MEYIDYYKVLGISRSATKDEIHKAFKKLARKYHPDVSKEPDAEDRFKQINEAQEVLSDPEKRQRYDRLGADWKHGSPFEPPPGWQGQGSPFNVRMDGMDGFSDFFSSIFSGFGGRGQQGGSFSFEDRFGGGGRRAGRGPRPPHKGQNVEGDLTISLEEAYHGTRRTIEISSPDGSPRRLDVKVPKGVSDGSRIRLAGQGSQGPGGGQPGDVLLKIHVHDHPLYERKDDDLYVPLPVAPWDAALGAQVNVDTLTGPITVKVPSGSSTGRKLRLKGKGMPKRNGKFGDLYAEVKIMVPKRLSKDEKKLFEQLRDTSRFKA